MSLDELRALAEQAMEQDKKATKGPWSPSFDDYGDEVWFGGRGHGMWSIGPAILGGDGRKTDGTENPEGLAQMEADATFIASARTREPKLAAALLELMPFVEHGSDCRSRIRSDITGCFYDCDCGLDDALDTLEKP